MSQQHSRRIGVLCALLELGCAQGMRGSPRAQPRTPIPGAATADGVPIATSSEELEAWLADVDPRVAASKAALDDIAAREKSEANAFEADFVWYPCDGGHTNCGLLAQQTWTAEHRALFSAVECGEPLKRSTAKLSKACVERYVHEFFVETRKRYPLAIPADVEAACKAAPEQCEQFAGYEALCMRSHDGEVLRRHQNMVRLFNDERAARLAEYKAALTAESDRRRLLVNAFLRATEQRQKRTAELRAIEAQEAQEELTAERRRSAGLAIAAGLKAYGDTLARRTASPQPSSFSGPPAQAQPATNHCSSDFDCGAGRSCLKGVGQFDGVCAIAVNTYGTQTFSAPDISSVGPGQRQCWNLAQCPAGFRCDDGQCVR